MILPKLSNINKGTYAAVRFEDKTLGLISDLQDRLKLYDRVHKDDIHSTIAFSRNKINFVPDGETRPIGYADRLKIFKTKTGKNALVLLLKSEYLHSRFKYAMDIGATYDFPDYQPHITLSYDAGDFDYSDFKVEPFEVSMSHEYVEDLDLDWKGK